jgi:hypothetical protein
MTKYIAFINVPGYLPESDTPVFDTPGEGWAWLAQERRDAEESVYETGDSEEFSDTVTRLEENARAADAGGADWADAYIGTVHGDTPGSDSLHDLGLAYGVGPVSESEAADILAAQD